MPETTSTTVTRTTTTTTAGPIGLTVPSDRTVINTKYLDDNSFDMCVKFGPQLPGIARFALVSLSLDGPRLPVLLACHCQLCKGDLAYDMPCTAGIPRDVDFTTATVFRLPRHTFDPDFYEHIVLILDHDCIRAKYADHILWHTVDINLNDHVLNIPECYKRKPAK